ncbi:MAG: beta tubulin, partial [Hyphomicrobiales bacterium]
TKFDNVVNFRGFPHVPGSDFVLRYPRAGAELDGRALFG